MKYFSRSKLIFLTILFILSSGAQSLQAQSAKTTLTIGASGYEVEVSLTDGIYKVSLKPDSTNPESEKVNYFTINTFRESVFKIHRRLLKAKNDTVALAAFNTAAENAADDAIKSSFLQLITELYNTEVKGQKIGTVTLNKEIPVKGLFFNKADSAKDKTEKAFDRSKNRWYGRIQKKRKKESLRQIRKLEKRDIKHGLDSADSSRLLSAKMRFTELKQLTLDYESVKKHNAQQNISSNTPNDTILTVENARIVFEDGTIKQITVKGSHDSKTKVFSNQFAIGTTTLRNFKAFDRIRLYQETHFDPKYQYVMLSDVIAHERLVALRTNDFSPADITIDLQAGKSQEIFKTSSTRLFSLNIFSDLIGFNANNPNGLVQLEFSKRINLWTRRTDTRVPLLKGTGIGFFTHMMPSFELAKIEENNRSIKLNQGMEPDGTMVNYLSPLEIFRFSFARTSNELNFFDMQGASLSIHLNGIAGVAVTQLQDTVMTTIFDEHINSLMLGANLKAIFNPESKWAFELGSKLIYFDPLVDLANLRERSVRNQRVSGPNHLLNSWEFLLTWNTGSDNKLFGRFRFNHEWKEWSNNFSEFQIGYSIFLKSNQVKNGKK